MLEIIAEDTETKARTGILNLPHGIVKTPAFMPVGTNGTVKAVTHEVLRAMGYSLILGNTYHLYLRPGEDVLKNAGSLHKFTGWDGNYLTDSGGYQIFSLAEFRKIKNEGVKFRSHIDGSYRFFTPESVVDTQVVFNSDIQMPLDVCTPPGISRKEALSALNITTEWARRAKIQWMNHRENYKGYLFGIIQGNFFKDLRKQSLEELLEIDFPGMAIGGLSVGESPEEFREYLGYTAEMLPKDKPRYVMGIGTPDYMLDAVAEGIDIFDCVYPTRVARNSSCFSSRGMISLKKEDYKYDNRPIDLECECPVCRKYSRSYLRHLFKAGEMLGPMLATEHNLYFLARLMDTVRMEIARGKYGQFRRSFMEKFYGVQDE